jgi:DHA2 family methylenomycin A resistance protein-like MFS transporter
VRELVPEERRGRVFGLIGAAVALAAASGPPLGGVLVEAAGWRAIFYVNLVLVLPALLMGWRRLPPSRAAVSRAGFDVKGAIMLTGVLAGTAALLMSIGQGATLQVPAMGAPAVIAMATLFVWHEFRHPDPVVRPRLFQQRAFAAANAGIGLRNLSMYTLLLSVPLLLAGRNGFSSLETGLVLTALSAAMVIVSPFGGQLADRFGRRLPTTIGGAILALGALPMALAGVDITLPFLVAGLVTVGIGIGLSTPSLQTTAVESVGKQEAGVASGIFSTSRYLGSIVGSAILAGALGAGRDDVDGIGLVFLIVFVAAVLSTVATLGLRARPEVYSGEEN